METFVVEGVRSKICKLGPSFSKFLNPPLIHRMTVEHTDTKFQTEEIGQYSQC